MRISFRLAGCVWCEACVGPNLWMLRQLPTCGGSSALPPRYLRCIQTCARVPSNTPDTHTYSGITFLEMPEASQGVSTKRCSFEKRARRVGGDPNSTPTICFWGWSQFGSISSLLIFLFFFTCSWGMALRHGTLVMLAIMLMGCH